MTDDTPNPGDLDQVAPNIGGRCFDGPTDWQATIEYLAAVNEYKAANERERFLTRDVPAAPGFRLVSDGERVQPVPITAYVETLAVHSLGELAQRIRQHADRAGSYSLSVSANSDNFKVTAAFLPDDTDSAGITFILVLPIDPFFLGFVINGEPIVLTAEDYVTELIRLPCFHANRSQLQPLRDALDVATWETQTQTTASNSRAAANYGTTVSQSVRSGEPLSGPYLSLSPLSIAGLDVGATIETELVWDHRAKECSIHAIDPFPSLAVTFAESLRQLVLKLSDVAPTVCSVSVDPIRK